MWCARCGRDDTELVWVMTSSRKTVLPMCADDRLCYPPKGIKKDQLLQSWNSKFRKIKLQTV